MHHSQQIPPYFPYKCIWVAVIQWNSRGHCNPMLWEPGTERERQGEAGRERSNGGMFQRGNVPGHRASNCLIRRGLSRTEREYQRWRNISSDISIISFLWLSQRREDRKGYIILWSRAPKESERGEGTQREKRVNRNCASCILKRVQMSIVLVLWFLPSWSGAAWNGSSSDNIV